MKIEVDLPQFRQHNGLTQASLANYMGVTRGYVSLVESRKSGMSSEKVSALLDLAIAYRWDTRPLFPSCWRLSILNDYAKTQGWKNVIQNEKDADDYCVSMDDWNRYMQGTLSITETFAHIVCQRYPLVYYSWIYEGEGPMLKDPKDTERDSLDDFLKRLDRKLDVIIAMLNGVK